MPLIGVTGATGGIGGRVAQRLAQRGARQRLIVRDPARAPQLSDAEVVAVSGGYHDGAGMEQALAGVDTLLLVSAHEAADRGAAHASAINAAVRAGVRRIVYTSFLGAAPEATFTFARDHHAAEELIRASSVAYTFLRDSQYLDYVPMLVTEHSVIAGPAGTGKIAWVARDDVAEAAVSVLIGTGHDASIYDLTGPEAHTMSWAAEQLSATCGRAVTYRAETIDEAYASRTHYGAPQWEVDGWVTSYSSVATGEMDVVTDHVERLTGHRGQTLPEFLAAHPESIAHLRAG